MHEAKRQGSNQFKFYSAEIERKLAHFQISSAELKYAIQHNHIEVYYQPKVNSSNGVITGLEALARWKKTDGSIVMPEVFIPLAEETGLIVNLGEYVLAQACEQLKNGSRIFLT